MKCLANPVGVTPEIENSPDDGDIILECVIYCIGEALGKQAIITKDLRVNTRISARESMSENRELKKYSPIPSACNS